LCSRRSDAIIEAVGWLGKRKEGSKMFERILLPLDGSAVAEQALPYAVAQAERFGAELILLRVIEPFPHVRGLRLSGLAEIQEQTREWTHEYLLRIAGTVDAQGIEVQTAAVEGRPYEAILQFAESSQIDLIVICTRGYSGVSRWLLGGVADRVVRGAEIPVLLIRAAKGTTGPPGDSLE
jgi:nucleotide-binding universal stress UspA family protein